MREFQHYYVRQGYRDRADWAAGAAEPHRQSAGGGQGQEGADPGAPRDQKQTRNVSGDLLSRINWRIFPPSVIRQNSLTTARPTHERQEGSSYCAVNRVSFQQNQSGNSLSGAKKVCDKIWPKLQLKVLFMAKFALNKSCWGNNSWKMQQFTPKTVFLSQKLP